MNESKHLTYINTSNNTSFQDIFTTFNRDKWNPIKIAEKISADRYRIERDDSNKVLFPRRAFPESFKLFTNDRIFLIGDALFTHNPDLIITDAISSNYGEDLQIKAKFSKKYHSQVKGIGEIEPSVILQFNLSKSNATLAFSYKQLLCENQIPSLRYDPISKVFGLKSSASDEAIISSCYMLKEYANTTVEEMLFRLERLGNTLITTQSAITLFSLVFRNPYIDIEKPKLCDELLELYFNAKNAAPNTLLGAVNALTNYFAHLDYDSNYNRVASYFPNNSNMSKIKKAMKHVTTASNLDNANVYFEAFNF